MLKLIIIINESQKKESNQNDTIAVQINSIRVDTLRSFGRFTASSSTHFMNHMKISLLMIMLDMKERLSYGTSQGTQ